jgi:hypothetical protein
MVLLVVLLLLIVPLRGVLRICLRLGVRLRGLRLRDRRMRCLLRLPRGRLLRATAEDIQ